MPRNILGIGSKDYCESEELRSPYYGSAVAHVQPQVLKIYAQLLPQALVAVFGEYEIMILFTYTDSKNNTTSSLQTLKKTFSELVDASEIIHTLQGVEIADIVAQAEFHPQVTCARANKSGYIWNVDISGVFTVTLSIDEPDEADAAPEEKSDSTQQECVPEQEDFVEQKDACGQSEIDQPEDSYRADINQYSQSQDEAEDSIAMCWQIGGFADLSFDSLCEMQPEEIDSYVAGDENGQNGSYGEFNDDAQ